MQRFPAILHVEPVKPKLERIHIRPVKNGFVVTHFHSPAKPGKLTRVETLPDTKAIQRFVFQNLHQMAEHVGKAAQHALWLGNKTATPKIPGAKARHRETQINATGY